MVLKYEKRKGLNKMIAVHKGQGRSKVSVYKAGGKAGVNRGEEALGKVPLCTA